MAIKKYFTGKSGAIFWLNVILAAVVLVGVPYALFKLLGTFTHHGEKIVVPDVVHKQQADADDLLRECGLVAAVSDSDYIPNLAPGTILAQSPKPGSEVKGGRLIYLTINRNGYPPVKLPDLVRNTTERIATQQLKMLGFKLAPTQYVAGEPAGLVVGIKQGSRSVNAGEMVAIDVALTIYAGAGIQSDSIDYEEGDSVGIVDEGGFDVFL